MMHTTLRHPSWRRWSMRLAGLAAAAMLVTTASAEAQWLNKSTMTFSRAVMVPGATLQPGEYVFNLKDIKPTLHTIEIMNKDESKTIAIVQAIPIKRMELDVTSELEFRNTPAGSPPALKAWFYPSTRYGHEFIYSDKDARKLATQGQTMVLAEMPGSDTAKSTLVLFDADGQQAPWKANEDVMREWDAWMKQHHGKGDKDTTDSDR